jgi:hypothetical protein
MDASGGISAIRQLTVRPIEAFERQRWQQLMTAHHYLGFKTLVGESLRYVAEVNHCWVSLIGWSAAALKCQVRDRWIGWSQPIQWQRLHLIANNSRFLVLPGWHLPNLASRVLSLNLKRLNNDWQQIFGHPILLVESFVDPSRFTGACYKAANFTCLGRSKGFGKCANRYFQHARPKAVFVRSLHRRALQRLKQPVADPQLISKVAPMKFTQKQLEDLIQVLLAIPDPRFKRGKRHRLISVLAIAICAVICGARSFAAIAEFAKLRTQQQLKKLRCRHDGHRWIPPSEPTIRRVLQRCDAQQVDHALLGWLASLCHDDALAFDGKTPRGSLHGPGKVHLLSLVTHQHGISLAQKPVATKTNEISVAKPMLQDLNVQGKVLTADALHTQVELARFVVEEKHADYFFVVKDNQSTLKNDIATLQLKNAFPPSGPNRR